uniref:R-spondin Fu-CRD domain-containing protein n=1 Tax=Dicentrarchus labrax TaxID=13489 RepID=A0A8C4GM28_DICLA
MEQKVLQYFILILFARAQEEYKIHSGPPPHTHPISLHPTSTGSSPMSRLCPAGCATCSALNGCLSCKPRLFFHLELDGMRQRGTCLSTCPRGHYGMRSRHISTCTKCSVGCEVCVRRNMCVRCRAGLYFLHGQCHLTCPRGFEPDVQFLQLHCQVGEWTDWGPCVRKRSMRAYRRGEETRTRQVLQSPSLHGDPCPHVSEIRKCFKMSAVKRPVNQSHNTYIKQNKARVNKYRILNEYAIVSTPPCITDL